MLNRAEHARKLRLKADGFYSAAAEAEMKGKQKKAERLFNRGLQIDQSATKHERLAREEEIEAAPLHRLDTDGRRQEAERLCAEIEAQPIGVMA